MVRKIVAYFSLLEDGTDAIEKLERGYHLALNQGARQYRRRCPPSCAYRHLPEPGFEGKTTTVTGGSAGPAAHQVSGNRWLVGLLVHRFGSLYVLDVLELDVGGMDILER